MPTHARSSTSFELENRHLDSDTTQLLQPPHVDKHGAWSNSTTPRVSYDYSHGGPQQSSAPPILLNLNATGVTEADENMKLLSATDSSIPGPDSTTNLSDIYQALPLSAGRKQIRVIDVDCISSNQSGQKPTITATLRAIDLDEKPIFTALSYMWGEYAEPKDEIVLWNNGSRFPVTKNCLSALVHLRDILGSFTIWIDAICINQKDDAEKTHQIRMMPDVYTSAHVVYYWLGEGNKKTDRAMSYLAKGALPFSTGIMNYIPQARRLGLMIPTGRSLSIRLGLSLYIRLLSGRIRPHYDGLDDIFSRPWIQRMWTLQEAVLPRRGVIVCGHSTIPWLAMYYSLKFMEHLHKRALTMSFPNSTREWRRLSSTWMRRLGDINHARKPKVETDDDDDVSASSDPVPIPVLTRAPALASDLLPTPIHTSDGGVESVDRQDTDDPNHPYLDCCQLESELDRHIASILSGWKLFRSFLLLHTLLILLCLLFFLGAIPAGILTWTGTVPSPTRFFPRTAILSALNVGFFIVLIAIPLFILRHTSSADRYRIYPFTNSETLAIELQRRCCGKAQDRYFAILSFLDRPRMLRLDIPVETVYRILMGRVVAHSESLDVLLFTGGKSGVNRRWGENENDGGGGGDSAAIAGDEEGIKDGEGVGEEEGLLSAVERGGIENWDGDGIGNSSMMKSRSGTRTTGRLFSDPDTPTWVVDWRVARPTWLHLRYYLSDRTLVRFMGGKKIRGRPGIRGRAGVFRYKGAALGPMVKCKFRGGKEMHVFGNLVSTLTWCSGPMGDGELGGKGNGPRRTTKRVVPSEEELLPSVEKFLMAIKGFRGYWTSVEDLAQHAMEEMGGRVPTNGRYYWGKLLGHGTEDVDSRDVTRQLIKQAQLWAWGGWFVSTSGGSKAWRVHRAMTNFLANEGMGLVRCESDMLTDFGWAPEGAREGDTVALISGVSLPMVLRKRPGTKYHEIVGPCFFIKAMGGEVWEKPELRFMENIVLV